MPASGLSRRALLTGAAAAGLLAACGTEPGADQDDNKNKDNHKETRMAEVLLMHHALGLTDGVKALADQLRQAGHTVHTPDAYQGRIFKTVDEGVAYARETGFGTIVERFEAGAEGLPDELVYIGISLGVIATQKLAQTRPGARAAVLLEAAVPSSEFGTGWPKGVPVQIHGMDADPSFVGEGDIEAAHALVKEAEDGELFLYPGNQHLFTDISLASYDAEATSLVVERMLTLLARV